MATNGNIETFNGKREDFVQYIERVEQFFLANDLEVIEPKDDNGAAVTKRNNKRKDILLILIGADTYSLLRNLFSPDKPADKTYAEIVKTLTDYFQPKPSATVQRFKRNLALQLTFLQKNSMRRQKHCTKSWDKVPQIQYLLLLQNLK